MADRMAEDSDDDSLKLELVDTPPKRSGPPASSTPHDLIPLPKPDFEESPQNLTTNTALILLSPSAHISELCAVFLYFQKSYTQVLRLKLSGANA